MNRRSLLALLGGAPLAAIMPKVAEAALLAHPIGARNLVINDFSHLAGGEIIDGGRIYADKIICNTITADKIKCGSCVVATGIHQPDGSIVWRWKDLVSGKFVE